MIVFIMRLKNNLYKNIIKVKEKEMFDAVRVLVLVDAPGAFNIFLTYSINDFG